MARRDSFGEFEATSLFCPRCKRATRTRRKLLLVLPSGTYLLTADMHTLTGNNLYLLKARDAITLNVRHETDSPAERRSPLLTVAFPWELESMAEAHV